MSCSGTIGLALMTAGLTTMPKALLRFPESAVVQEVKQREDPKTR